MTSKEFTCADCGVEVIAIVIVPVAANDPYLCATCSWLRTVKDPDEREHLRKFLQRDRTPR